MKNLFLIHFFLRDCWLYSFPGCNTSYYTHFLLFLLTFLSLSPSLLFYLFLRNRRFSTTDDDAISITTRVCSPSGRRWRAPFYEP